MNKFLSVFLLVAVLGIPKSTARIPVSEFYPFGEHVGDHRVPTADDNFVEHILPPGNYIHFFNQPYDRIFINNNGGVSFIRGVPQFTPTCGSQDTPMVIPFWADVDTRNGGSVWYRESTDTLLLSQATREVLTAFPGLRGSLNVNKILIITWDDVAFFGSASCGPEAQAKRNSFQTIVALGDDGHMSFIIFNYDSVNWVTGRASGGECDGRGGTPAKSGFDTGDHVNFYSLPGSCSEEISNVVETTNVNLPGKWIFRVDQEHIEDPTDPMPEPVTDDPEQIVEPGHCNPEDCSLRGYCYQYAQCDYESRTFRNFYCSHGLYWNPHNNSIEAPHYGSYEVEPVLAAAGRSLKAKSLKTLKLTKQLDHHEYDHTGAPPHHEHEEECHGSCDLWDNLSPEVQALYIHDEECFPRCYYAQVAECENRYVFHPHNTDARHVEYVDCPVDTRHGMHIPMVWVQERETCDLCYNAYRTDVNGTVSPCCERYDDFVETPGSSDEPHYPSEGVTDNYHDGWHSTDYPHGDNQHGLEFDNWHPTDNYGHYPPAAAPAPAPGGYYPPAGAPEGHGFPPGYVPSSQFYPPGRSLNKNTKTFDNKRKI